MKIKIMKNERSVTVNGNEMRIREEIRFVSTSQLMKQKKGIAERVKAKAELWRILD